MKYFGTDGIRGIYGQTLDDELAYKAGLAASRLIGNTCFVGRDTRTSGDALCEAVTEGLTQGGCEVRLVGVVPTPAISFLAAKYGAGGIMVSASHNPPEYNGLKFFSPMGCKFTAQFENSIEEYIDRPPARVGGGKVVRFDSGREEYIDRVCEGAGDLGGREIALDCAYGAASMVAGEAFARCGAKVKLYASESDGSKINCGVGALNPEFLESVDCETGFAFDGDGDRLAVKSNGILDGDSVLYDLALLMRPKGVVGTVMNNIALENELNKMDIRFIRTAVGDKNIGEAMRRYGYPLGGEQSGHYIISPATSGDALYAALTLSKLPQLKRLDLVPQAIVSIETSPKILSQTKFADMRASCERELAGKGRLVVRMSGTEPKIRLMAECEDQALLKDILQRLSETINLCNKEIL